MPDATCEQLNCCPPGYAVPGLGGTLSLAGDDSTATDPRVAAGEYIWAEEAQLTRGTLINGDPDIVVDSVTNIQQGYAVECIGVYKDIVATFDSYDVTVTDTDGLKTGQLIDESTTYFPYGTTITSIAGLTVTLSNKALVSTPASPPEPPTEVLFRSFSPPLIVGASVVIQSTLYPSSPAVATTVTNIAGTTLTLSVAPTAPMTKALLSFFPAEIDPNVKDEDQLFT